MATDGRTPQDFDQEVFEKGRPVATLAASQSAAEEWVGRVAQVADARLDWCYVDSVLKVVHLGDDESRTRVEAAIHDLKDSLDGTILSRFNPKRRINS